MGFDTNDLDTRAEDKARTEHRLSEYYEREDSDRMEDGIYKISFEEYLKDPCPEPSLSRSTIKALVNDCPARAFYEHPRLNPNYKAEEDTKFDIGSAAHDLFLGGEGSVIVLDFEDWRKKEAKSSREDARASGLTPILGKQYEELKLMVDEANKSLARFEARGEKLNLEISQGDSEQTYIWKEDDTWLRIRPDWTTKDKSICLDYKTTKGSADPEEYASIASNTGLDIQMSLYCRGIEKLTGIKPDFYFMVQEIYPPYLCSFIELGILFEEMGNEKVRQGINLWRKCLSTGYWPGYSRELQVIEPKAYSLGAWEFKKSILSL